MSKYNLRPRPSKVSPEVPEKKIRKTNKKPVKEKIVKEDENRTHENVLYMLSSLQTQFKASEENMQKMIRMEKSIIDLTKVVDTLNVENESLVNNVKNLQSGNEFLVKQIKRLQTGNESLEVKVSELQLDVEMSAETHDIAIENLSEIDSLHRRIIVLEKMRKTKTAKKEARQKKQSSYHNVGNTSEDYGYKDLTPVKVAGDGNCLFSSIALTLGLESQQIVRNELSIEFKNMSKEDYEKYYESEKLSDRSKEKWWKEWKSCTQKMTEQGKKKLFKEFLESGVKKSGNFWGDFTTLELASKRYKIGFLLKTPFDEMPIKTSDFEKYSIFAFLEYKDEHYCPLVDLKGNYKFYKKV